MLIPGCSHDPLNKSNKPTRPPGARILAVLQGPQVGEGRVPRLAEALRRQNIEPRATKTSKVAGIRSEQPRLPSRGPQAPKQLGESLAPAGPACSDGQAVPRMAALSTYAAGSDMLGRISWALRLELMSFGSAMGKLIGRRHLFLHIPSLLSEIRCTFNMK